MKETEEYQGVFISKNRDNLSYQTRLSTFSRSIEVQMNVYEQAEDNIHILISRLESDLRQELFSESTIKLMEIIRFITDLKTLGTEILKKGSILVGSLKASKYVRYIRQVTNTLNEVDDEEIKENYKAFVKKFEVYLSGKNSQPPSSMNIIEDFLNTDLKLCNGVEITIQGILCAALKLSVESVVETIVSRYEKHFEKGRQLTEENALCEMEIAEN